MMIFSDDDEVFVHIFIAIIIIVLILALIGFIYSIFKKKISFFITGLDAAFTIPDLILLWNVAKICNLEEPKSLFYSMPSLTKCMAQITNTDVKDSSGKSKNQKLIARLFDYRTKLQNETDDKKGLQSTKFLDKGQKLRILLPGKGVFASEILNNGTNLIVSVPRQKDLIPFSAEEWVGKVISVYLWRKGDAKYVFDTSVTESGLFIGQPALYLKHSNNLTRTQKRKSVRAKCEIYGNLYIIKEAVVNYDAIETQNGYRCLIEDISESGAQIKIGGKGVENVQIKLQFTIHNMLIVMFGIIRTVQYNQEENKSLLHFECVHIEPEMRNEILKFVYQILPAEEKEVIEAINQTDQDNPDENSEDELEKRLNDIEDDDSGKNENSEDSENPENTETLGLEPVANDNEDFENSSELPEMPDVGGDAINVF
jgi:c-di-GMP-binding flagellar brake protein YcgR